MISWTKEQEEAIETSGTNLLVAAAAGSGKTAVLVERIIQKLLDENNPVNIDEILVATFTNAAAEEMRNRIGKSLEEAIAASPGSYHLKKQLSLLQRASISTLHAFCTLVVRQNAYILDLDPAFRIGNEMEIDLIKQEVIGEMFEEMYSKEGEEAEQFLQVVNMYAGDRSDVEVENVIMQLYTFAMQNPWPLAWLENVAATYDVPEDVEESALPWLEILKAELVEELAAYEADITRALEITQEVDGPSQYKEAIESDLKLIKMAANHTDDWNKLQEIFRENSLKRLSSKKTECDESKKERVKNLRSGFSAFFRDTKKVWFSRDLSAHLADMRTLYPAVRELTRLVIEFRERFTKVKRERALVDFLDLEHFCLAILLDPASSEGNIIPSDVAMGYKRQFKEVLVDEYQDINLVQETILAMVSDQTGRGNMFMVGDVKQSIYRFRHADPTLFLEKYKRYVKDESTGKRIDLAENFRSRAEVLTGANYIFRQVFDESLGEIEYDERAELIYGNKAFDKLPIQEPEAELILIDNDSDLAGREVNSDEADLDKVQLEARLYAQKIREWIGKTGKEPMQVVDKQPGEDGKPKFRDLQFRDIVILQRSLTGLSVMMAELKKQGIPVHAEQRVGYFAAIEIQVMLSMLQVIDNPFQDIPLAAVLRSPIVGLTEEQLTKIRLTMKNEPYYVALKEYAKANDDASDIVRGFLAQLKEFRELAREGALSELIWHVFRETGYYDFVGGIPGGRQRQANLRALHDRAKGYEETSFRGLFRFLRFIESMLEKRMDLGEASALSEQEDVVRIMTIHRSKGLEFPVVMIGGMDKEFNYTDLRRKYMLDKELGFATKFIDVEKQITYPTLFHLALQKEGARKLLAEEMRVLYVALTRAEEKLVMIGNVDSFKKEVEKWQSVMDHKDWVLPNGIRKKSRAYLSLVGPALVRHESNEILHGEQMLSRHIPEEITKDQSKWKIEVIPADALESVSELEKVERDVLGDVVQNWQPLKDIDTDQYAEVDKRLRFSYDFEDATEMSAKQSVTEIKRRKEIADSYSGKRFTSNFQSTLVRRPSFMQAKNKLSASEMGTAMHTVMQHIPLSHALSSDEIKAFLADLVDREILTKQEKESINISLIEQFFQTKLGELMLRSPDVQREVPFMYALSAKEVYPDWKHKQDEQVMIQGVVDCLIRTETGIIIVDYKTDRITGDVTEETLKLLRDRYKVQVDLYRQAISDIIQEEIEQTYLYFFDKNVTIEL